MSVPLPGPVAEWLVPNGHPDRPQMILSTVDAAGAADARTVLLTEFDDSGFYFHTDSRSRKVEEIAAHPAVALTFLWPGFTRQLVVRGEAVAAPAEEIRAAWEARSPYLRQLAWQNTADFARLPLEERRQQWGGFAVPDEEPATWTGFVVRPTRLTFWTSNPDTASRRQEYTLTGGTWALDHLPG